LWFFRDLLEGLSVGALLALDGVDNALRERGQIKDLENFARISYNIKFQSTNRKKAKQGSNAKEAMKNVLK